MRYVIDIDGTICTQETIETTDLAKPYKDIIKKINRLHDDGNYIIMFTARTGDYYRQTKKQLEDWGLKFHQLVMNKPHGDIYVDDKAAAPRVLIGL